MPDATLDCLVDERAVQLEPAVVCLVHRDHEDPVAGLERGGERFLILVARDGNLGRGQIGRPLRIPDDYAERHPERRKLPGDVAADDTRHAGDDDRHRHVSLKSAPTAR